MSVPRKIYTSSEVMIRLLGDMVGAAGERQNVTLHTADGAAVSDHAGIHSLLVPTVTSATFTIDTPRENVTVFGRSGQVDTVQNESTTATMEIVFHPWDRFGVAEGNQADPEPWDEEAAPGLEAAKTATLLPADLDAIMVDAEQDLPRYVSIWVHGVGSVDDALLSSITAEGSVGALPTITLSFDGKPGLYRHYDHDGGAANVPAGWIEPTMHDNNDDAAVNGGKYQVTAAGSAGLNGFNSAAFGAANAYGTTKYIGTSTIDIANMEDVGVNNAYATTGDAVTGGNAADDLWVQSATFSWEMPIERINKLTQSPDDAVSYGSPPGTASIAVEGIERVDKIIQLTLGHYTFRLPTSSEVASESNNLAVGEVGATYNVTTEGTAAGCVCLDITDPDV